MRPFPEEMNRRLLGNLATLHFAPTERAAAHLRAEGVGDEDIYVTGNPVVDALLWASKDIDERAFAGIDEDHLILVTAH